MTCWCLQESEAVSRALRELCTRNGVMVPPELDGGGSTGAGSAPRADVCSIVPAAHQTAPTLAIPASRTCDTQSQTSQSESGPSPECRDTVDAFIPTQPAALALAPAKVSSTAIAIPAPGEGTASEHAAEAVAAEKGNGSTAVPAQGATIVSQSPPANDIAAAATAIMQQLPALGQLVEVAAAAGAMTGGASGTVPASGDAQSAEVAESAVGP